MLYGFIIALTGVIEMSMICELGVEALLTVNQFGNGAIRLECNKLNVSCLFMWLSTISSSLAVTIFQPKTKGLSDCVLLGLRN